MARTDLIGSYLEQVEQALGDGDRARLVEELEGHLEDAVTRHVAAGMSPHQAVSKALEDCGSAADVATAVQVNNEREDWIMAVTRWTGLAGIVSVPLATAGLMFWHPITFVLTFAAAVFAVLGLLAAHWRMARSHIVVGVALFLAGNVVAGLYPQGTAGLLVTTGIPAAFTLAAVTLACVAFLRGSLLPVPAVLATLAGVALLLGVSTALYFGGDEQPVLVAIGTVAAVSGWLWMNGAVVARGFQHRPVSAA